MKSAPFLALSAVVALAACKGSNSSSADAAPAGSGSASGPAASPPPADTSAASTVLPLSGFEGEIDLVIKGKTSPNPVPLNLLVKNDTVRVDLPSELLEGKAAQLTGGGKVYALLKTPQKKLFAVLDAKKEAVEVDLDQAGEQMKAMHGARPGAAPPTAPPPEPPKVTKTGKKETIAGLTCEDWEIKNADKSKMDICVSDKVGVSFFHLPISGIPTEHAWALELVDGNHIPLKGVFFEKDGSEGGRVEVTKLDKHTVDATLMDVPAGYQTLTMQQMIAGMMGGAGVPPGTPLDIPPGMGGHGHGPHHHGGHKPPQ